VAAFTLRLQNLADSLKSCAELTDCSTRHVQRTDRELARVFPPTARTAGYAVPAATACGRRVGAVLAATMLVVVFSAPMNRTSRYCCAGPL